MAVDCEFPLMVNQWWLEGTWERLLFSVSQIFKWAAWSPSENYRKTEWHWHCENAAFIVVAALSRLSWITINCLHTAKRPRSNRKIASISHSSAFMTKMK